MQVKTFELRVEVTAETVEITTPGGTRYPHEHDELPTDLYSIVKTCLLEDSELSRRLANTIKPAAEQA